jgi:GNAT superfamily N-acetyltransferase
MSLRIRPAAVNDAAAIGRIHVETWQSSYAGVLPSDYLAALNPVRRGSWWAGEIRRPQEAGRILVAEDPEHGVVGFGSCGQARRVPAAWKRVKLRAIGEVYTLYVEPDWQNRGIGRALLEALFARLEADGHSRAMLWVLAMNPSRFFYEAMGGQRIGSLGERVAGAEVEEWAYGWETLEVG